MQVFIYRAFLHNSPFPMLVCPGCWSDYLPAEDCAVLEIAWQTENKKDSILLMSQDNERLSDLIYILWNIIHTFCTVIKSKICYIL